MASMPAPALQPRVDQLPPVDLDRMRTHAEDAATLLRSVGNPQRLLILCELVEAEAGVGAPGAKACKSSIRWRTARCDP